MDSLRGYLRRIFLFSIALVAACILSAGCASKKESSTKLKVVATIPVLADWVREVGGSRVKVTTLLSPGASPHTFEPLPSQARDVSEADFVCSIGLDIDRWLAPMLSANSRMLICSKLEGITLIDETEHEQDTHSREANPHIWLDPQIAKLVVRAISDSLSLLDPEGKSTYTSNALRYIERLDSLDKEILKTTSGFSKKEYVAFHPAWAYFDQRYGLQEIAVIMPSAGKEPSPRHLTDVVKAIKKSDVSAVFVEPQFSPKAAEVIAIEAGARVVTLDPLGADNESYIELMEKNLEVMASVMGAK